jgi:DNA-binding transcriptional MerR regulator
MKKFTKTEEKEIKITELAKRFNVTDNTIRNWEKEKPQLMKIIRLGLKCENYIKLKKMYKEEMEEIMQIIK